MFSLSPSAACQWLILWPTGTAQVIFSLPLSGFGWRLQPGNHQPRLQDWLVGAQLDGVQAAFQVQETAGEAAAQSNGLPRAMPVWCARPGQRMPSILIGNPFGSFWLKSDSLYSDVSLWFRICCRGPSRAEILVLKGALLLGFEFIWVTDRLHVIPCITA